MISINIRYNSADLQRIGKKLSDAQEELLRKVAEKGGEIAEEATNAMVAHLQAHAKQPTGHLASLLKATYRRRKNQIILSMGNTAELTREAPYWYVLNYGKRVTGDEFIPPKNVGKWERGKWVHYGEKGLMTTKSGKKRLKKGFQLLTPHSFTPVNYIQAGKEYVMEKLRRIKELIKKVG